MSKNQLTVKEIIDICNKQIDRGSDKVKLARSNAGKESAKASIDFFSSIVHHLESLEHYKDSTCGFYAIDRDPDEVDINWIRENAFQIDYKELKEQK